jgi:hypothetical protein
MSNVTTTTGFSSSDVIILVVQLVNLIATIFLHVAFYRSKCNMFGTCCQAEQDFGMQDPGVVSPVTPTTPIVPTK